MRRTRETAQVAADLLGLPVAVDGSWIEAGFGDWEGLTYAEVVERDPQFVARWQGSTTLAPPGSGGESLDDVVARVRVARAAVVAAHPGRTVLVVTHATPVRVVVHEALAAGPAALWRLRVTPCAVTAVRYWQDGGIEVVTANATAHLAAD
jgi:probable phosphoglycerate mutase